MNVSPGVPMEIGQDEAAFSVYHFSMPDGSSAYVRVDPETEIIRGGTWSVRRQGLENVRWQASGDGRIDYFIERVWAESAGIPRWLHAWVEASETGEISDAEALVFTLRSCDLQMCPAPGPVSPPVTPEAIADVREVESPEPLQTEAVAAAEPVPAETETPVAEPVAQVSEAQIRLSGTETIVEIVRVPLPSETESADGHSAPEADASTDIDDAADAEPGFQTNDDEADAPPEPRSGPVMLTGDDELHPDR